MIFQNEIDDCGRACLRNYLSILMKDRKYETYPFEKTSDFLSMKHALEKVHVSVEGRLEKDLFLIDKKCYPLIAQILYPSGRLHFVVITKRIGARIQVVDSEFGVYFLSIEEFLKVYTGKVLITKLFSRKKRKDNCRMISNLELLLYFLLFVFQSLSMTLLFFFLSEEIAFEIKIILLISSFFFIFIQVLLNKKTRKRIDTDILIPFLESTGNYNDYANLSSLISSTINRYSSMVSYGSSAVLSFFVFLSNGNFVIALGFVSLFFSFLIFFMNGKYCKIDRDCSLKEEMMRSKLSEKGFSQYFFEARDIASSFEETVVALCILEALVLSILTILEMAFGKRYSLNFYLFYLFLGLSFTMLFYKLLRISLDETKIRTKINSLSQPLDISVKSFSHFVYNNRAKCGGKTDGRISACTGLSGQHTSEKETE